MSFYKKLFFWTKSNRIRESDTKSCVPPSLDLPVNFPKRTIFISNKQQTKIYHNQSSSTSDLSVDNSVQCEIKDTTVWHKKKCKKEKMKNISESNQNKNIDDSNAHNDSPLIGININFGKSPKKLRTNSEIDLSGIEDFIKKSKPQKYFTGFIFDDQTPDLSNKDINNQEDIQFLKPFKEDEDYLQSKTNELSKNDDSKDIFIPNFQNNNKSENDDTKLHPKLVLPKPKGYFVFDFDQ